MRRSTPLRLVLAAAVGIAALLAPPAAGQAPARLSSTWLPYWNGEVAAARIADNADLFHTVSPFWYRAPACDSVGPRRRRRRRCPRRGPAQPRHRRRANGDLDDVAGHGPACFHDPSSLSRARRPDCSTSCDPGSYDGLEINYEHLALTTDAGMGVARAGRVQRLRARALRRAARRGAGSACTPVMPRTDDSSSVWRGKLIPAVYDYRAIGAGRPTACA
jgi:hypothetical protein